MPKNHYRILEVDRHASPEVIEKAYKALAMKYHPDKWPPERREWATAKMQELNTAYRLLSDPERRYQYDQKHANISFDIFLEEGLLGLFNIWRSRQ